LEKEGKALVVELEESRKNASGLNEERAALVKENESLVSEKSTLEDALKRSRQEFKDVQKVNRQTRRSLIHRYRKMSFWLKKTRLLDCHRR
jgi:hypothetical protein